MATAPDDAQHSLVTSAVAGDEAALQCLLMDHNDALAARVAARMPKDLNPVLSADDVLQDVYITVFRKIGEFEPRGAGGFRAWLEKIAERRLWDLIDANRAAKRGGGRVAAEIPANSDASSIVGLLELAAVHSHTPSRSAAGHEAAGAVRDALETLKQDQREALRLRYFEGLSVAEAAERMGRSDGAVHMLCHRGLESLRDKLGDLSRFLTQLP